MLLRYLLVFLSAAGVVAGASLVWPRLTNRPRPEPLTKVRDAVVSTQQGAKAAEILGVENDAAAEPINIASMASSAVSAAVNAVEDRARATVIKGIAEQVMGEVAKLPEEEKVSIKELICR